MKTPFRFILLYALAFGLNTNAQTVPALVNYQGQLSNPDGTALPTADYTLTFNLYDAATNGALVWGPQVFDGSVSAGHGALIPVVQGWFNVMLGPADTTGRALSGAFGGASRYLEIIVSNRPPISPRQQILTTPFAFQAANSAKLAGHDWSAVFGINDPVTGKMSGTKIADGTITSQQIAGSGSGLVNLNASSLASGTVPDGRIGGTYATAVTFNNGANSFTGNGAGLTSLNASSLASGTVPDARLSGNVARLNQANTFAGNISVNDSVLFPGVGRIGAANEVTIQAGSALYLNPFGGGTVQVGGVGGGNRLFNVSGDVTASGNVVASGNVIASGNIGIGTSTPADRLHVAGAARAAYLTVTPQGGTEGGEVLLIGASGTDFVVDVIDTRLRLRPSGSASGLTVTSGGRVGVGDASPSTLFQVAGVITCTSVNQTSDRNEKENVTSIDALDVLDRVVTMPISRWNFKAETNALHIGPMAQDFHSAFGVGTDEKHIATVDADGVALAAIQGLNQKLETKLRAQAEELKELRQRLSRLDELEAQLKRLTAAVAPGTPSR